jgi:uncharacterized protein YceK
MKPFLFAVILAGLLSLALNGCSGILLHQAMDKGQNLTPAQIREYNESGHAVYGCFQISGPALSGSTVWIIVPKGTPVTFSFSDNCHLIPFATRP